MRPEPCGSNAVIEMFGQTQRLRRLAARVLLVWLFALTSGIVNACTFLGGSAGVAGGATAFALGGFVAVLAMIAIARLIGAVLSRGIVESTCCKVRKPTFRPR